MHGMTSQETLVEDPPAPPRPAPIRRVAAMIAPYRMLLLIVVLPTLVVTVYFGLIASPQYISEAHFVVRASGSSAASASGISQLLGLNNTVSPSQTESAALGDYLTSHDAVRMLDDRVALTGMFRRPGVDWLSRLASDSPPETVLKYYRCQVHLAYNAETGITTMQVRAFRPEDSLAIARTLLEIGERRVNLLNKRAYDDALAVSRRQLQDAEQELVSVQGRMTGFREQSRDIDPQRSSTAQIQLVSELQGRLAAAKAQLSAMGQAVRHDAPQYLALRQQVAALEAQANAQSGKLTGSGMAMAADLGGYENLQLRQDFAAKRYAAAAAGLQSAREQAVRQQLFVVRTVEPNLPVKSLYPQSFKIIASVFFGLLLAYAVGWLIVAGVREHAA